jgi:ABC-type sugar transport system substrate-binding protein
MSARRPQLGPALAALALTFALGALGSICAPLGALAAETSTRPATAKPLPAKPAMVMPWIEDDYTRAMAEAAQRKVPIFVESWAPW